MISIFRGAFSVLAGCLAAMSAMVIFESVGHVLLGPPPGVDFSKPVSMAEVAAKLRPIDFAPVLLGWAVGSFLGASIASKLAGTWKVGHGLIVGVVFMAAAVGNMLMIPHPVWIWVVGLAVFLPMAFLGGMIGAVGRESVGPPPAGA